MIKHLRIKLTIWFFILVMVAYILAGLASFWSISNRLNISIENDLMHMCEEIAPAVDYENGKPTLSNWERAAARRHISAQTTIQLFGADEHLLEFYGPKGTQHLVQGKYCSRSNKDAIYSHYLNLPDGSFVQVQLASTPYDQTLADFTVNEVLRGIPLAFLLAIFGWLYSGRAVAPITKSLNTLRNFVDDAGHELNTPIALIENSIETIEADLCDHNLPTGVLKIIQRASNTLKGMSQNLLLLAKMEQPNVTLHLSPVKLDELVIDVIQDFDEPARAKNIELQGHFDLHVHNLSNVLVLADRDMLVEVFSNLIANALRYTASGGQIYIYSFRSENNICIAIRDTGCGIPKECLPNIFDRFYRVDKARSKKEGGNGLGLSIVKAIVKAHKGSVRVESVLGKGSTFFINLPIVNAKQLKSYNIASEKIKPETVSSSV